MESSPKSVTVIARPSRARSNAWLQRLLASSCTPAIVASAKPAPSSSAVDLQRVTGTPTIDLCLAPIASMPVTVEMTLVAVSNCVDNGWPLLSEGALAGGVHTVIDFRCHLSIYLFGTYAVGLRTLCDAACRCVLTLMFVCAYPLSSTTIMTGSDQIAARFNVS